MTWPAWPASSASGKWWPARSSVPAITPRRWSRRMSTPILLPDLGISPVILSIWYADVGDPVLEGERVVEVLGNGVTFDVIAPASGKLSEKRAFPRETLAPGQV